MIHPVHSQIIQNTDPMANLAIALPGKPASMQAQWTNNLNSAIYIFAAYVWIGVSMGNRGDVSYTLSTPVDVILDSNDDHYEDRGGLPENKDWLPPMGNDRAFVLNSSETVTLAMTSNCDAGTQACVAQAYARIYYTLE